MGDTYTKWGTQTQNEGHRHNTGKQTQNGGHTHKMGDTNTKWETHTQKEKEVSFLSFASAEAKLQYTTLCVCP